jgi:hypothetical protein
MQIRSVSVDGDHATARIRGVSDHPPIPLTRSGGRWRIAGFAFPSREARDIPAS